MAVSKAVSRQRVSNRAVRRDNARIVDPSNEAARRRARIRVRAWLNGPPPNPRSSSPSRKLRRKGKSPCVLVLRSHATVRKEKGAEEGRRGQTSRAVVRLNWPTFPLVSTMDFDDKLQKAIDRGHRRSDARTEAIACAALTEEEFKRLHSKFRLRLSERIEECLKRVPNHFPGFRYETMFGDRGWAQACFFATTCGWNAAREPAITAALK